MQAMSRNGGRIMVAFEIGAMEWIDAWRGVYREEELDLWPNTSIAASEDWGDRFEHSLFDARAVVVLLSEKLLHSEYREFQRAWRALEKENDGGKPVVLVVLEPCPWPEFEQFRMMASREDRTRVIELDSLDPKSRKAAWGKLGTELREEFLPDAAPIEPSGARDQWVPQSRINDHPLTEPAREILNVAAELARRRGQELLPLSTGCVLFALTQDSHPTAAFVRNRLEKHGKTRIEEIAERFFLHEVNFAAQQQSTPSEADRIRVGQSMTPNVDTLLQVATDLAESTTKTGVIEVRHLAAALLFVGDHPFRARELLTEAGTPLRELSQDFLEHLASNFPDDNLDHWAEMLEGRLPKGGGKRGKPTAKKRATKKAKTKRTEGVESAESSPPLPGVLLAGFDADYWHQRDGEGEANPDLLDIKDEVNALASLAAAWSVEPPLSIGLFGDWGSGKTFFMRKMMERVNVLAHAARKSGQPQRDIGFYKNIVQIEFNAWHYVEGNLWASLVEHIFANLRLAGTDEAEDPDGINRLRKKLFEDLRVAEEFKASVEAKAIELESARDKARGRHEQARKKHGSRTKALAALRAKDVWSVIEGAGTSSLSAEQINSLQELGFGQKAISTTRELHETLEQLRGLGSRTRVEASTLLRLGRQPGQFAVLLSGLAGVAVLGIAVAVGLRTAGLAETSGLAAFSTQAIAFLGGALAWIRRQADRADRALTLLEPIRQEINRSFASAEEKRDRLTAQLEMEVELLSAECVVARRAVEQAEQNVADLQAQLEETTPTRQLARFIEDRAASEDYRRHLGILAVIRRDFEKLARLVARQREEERQGNEPRDDPTRINRIILYIDDLDRCPPQKVVEVLQAIHLLLAFPLFVVVVGVDSRWISRSLEKMYSSLLNPPTEQQGREESEGLPGRGASPRDYLEKIFQIPFWIRPMQADDCRKLIAGLTADSPPDEPSLSKRGEPTPAEAQRTTEPEPSRPVGQPASGSAGKAVTKPDRTTPTAKAEPEDRIQAVLPKQDTSMQPSSQKKPAVAEGEATRETVELKSRALKLEPWELEFMNELTSVLTRSPRSVKRFINCYRLIKAHLKTEQLEAFVGGSSENGRFKPVMLLLALLNGTPVVADKILDRLTNPCPLFTFRELMGALALHARGENWNSVKEHLNQYWHGQPESSRGRRFTVHQLMEELDAFSPLAAPASGEHTRDTLEAFAGRMDHYSLQQFADELNSDTEMAGRAEWTRVHQFLQVYGDSDLQSLRRAAPFVARFSFRVSDIRPGRQTSEGSQSSEAELAPSPASEA